MIFAKRIGYTPQPNQLDRTISSLQGVLNNQQITNPSVTKAVLATESIREDQVHLLNNASNELSMALEAISVELGIDNQITKAQIDAAVAAGMLAGDVQRFLGYKNEMPVVSTESIHVVNMLVEDGLSSRPFALEAYDERENRQAAVYSIAYNLQASRQDEFGETFFPTIVVTPDNVGFGVTVRLLQVMNDLQRQISGALDNYAKKNIIRAFADPTILKNELTRITPVYRVESEDKFVPAATIAPRTVDIEGEAIQTSALAVGKEFSLLGISQTANLLANGVMDVTDSIEPAINLTYLYVKVGADVLRFNVSTLPLANFTYSTQNNYRVMSLNFETTSVLINKDTKQVDGSALADLAGVVTNDLIVRLKFNASGKVNIETADTVVFGNHVGVSTVQDNAGTLLSLSAPPASDLVTLFATAEIIGYELQAYRTNSNRRQRGQLVDTTYYTQLYNVPVRSPITAIHPVSTDGQTDTSDLQALITATRIRTSNAAVTALINATQLLREYIDARDTTGLGPDVLGVGRFFVKPTYYEEAIDMNDIVDSIKSHERAADIQAALVSKIRDYAYRMYRDSEYKAAADAMAGGISQVPTVIIGTDPVLARYLTVSGDLRTLGGEFDVRIVSTLDFRVAGRIFVTFGVFDESRNTAPNPLSFGNAAWSPELSIVLPISRSGQISKELAVSPRFLHVVNLPVLTMLEITNIPDVLRKVQVLTHSV